MDNSNESVGKHDDIKMVSKDKRRHELVYKPNHRANNSSPKNLLAIQMKKARVNMTKSVFLGFPILDFVKLRCTFLIQSYGNKSMMVNLQLCYIDTDSVIINTKTSNFFNDKSKDIEERLDIFSYEVERTSRQQV